MLNMVIARTDLNWGVVKQASLRVRELQTERSGAPSEHLSSWVTILTSICQYGMGRHSKFL